MNTVKNIPTLCLKANVSAALVNGKRVTLSAPPKQTADGLIIPKEALALVGINAAEGYVSSNEITGLYRVYEGMGLLFLNKEDGHPGYDTEADLVEILTLAHSFIFDIEVGKLALDYAPATAEEREGFIKVGRRIRSLLLERSNTHPFLFGTQEIFDKLRKIYSSADGSEEYKLIKSLIDRADRYASNFPALNEKGDGLVRDIDPTGYGETEYDVGGRHSHSEGRLLEIAHLAFAYQMTLDDRYAKQAYYCTLGVISRLHWGPGHFLNCSGATMRLSMVYDWLYNAWKGLKLDTGVVKRGIYTQGLHHGFNSVIHDSCDFPSPMQGTGWRFKLKNDNWNSVCNSGMIIGSLCVLAEGADEVINEEEYEKVTELLGASLTSTMQPRLVYTQYAPDGSYVESNSYWAYGTVNLMNTMASLYDSLGTDLGLSRGCGLDKTCYYAINTESADFVGWNYHDGHASSQDTSAFNQFALISGDHSLFAIRRNQLEGGKYVSLLDMMYHPTVRGVEIPELDAMPLDYAMEGIDAFTVRSGWEKGSLFAGMIGGANPSGGSHCQIDSGAFVYHNLGKLWITDLGPDNYNSRGIKNGIGYFGNNALYKRNAEGNNCLCLTSLPYGQLTGGRGYMTEYKSSLDASYCIIENSTVYGEDKVKNAKRGMLLTNGRKTLVIKDEVEFKDTQTAFNTLHFESDKIKADLSDTGKKCALTHKDGERIYLTLLGDGHFELLDCKEGLLTGTEPAEGEQSRDNYSRLVIHYKKAKSINTAVVIDTDENSKYNKNTSIDTWKAI